MAGRWTTEDDDAAEAVDRLGCSDCGGVGERVTFVAAGRGRQAQAICLGCGRCGPIADGPAEALEAWNAMWRGAGAAAERA